MNTKLIALAFSMVVISAPSIADSYDREYPNFIMSMHQTNKDVEFDHQRHTNLDCSQCHHQRINDVESFTPYKCSSCHSTKASDKSKSNSYFKIIHGKKTLKDDPSTRCLACHTQEQKQRSKEQTSLTNCTNGSCHK